MGSRLGPNYACLFVGHVEEQIFVQYTGTKPALYKRYINDIVDATSGSREEIKDFATYFNIFHPSLNFTRTISDVQLPFLHLCLKPIPDRLLTRIHYKENDTHSYLNYTCSHPTCCKNSIPYSQFMAHPLQSVYGTSAVRAKKCPVFSGTGTIHKMSFSECRNKYQLSLLTPSFRSVQLYLMLNLPSHWC